MAQAQIPWKISSLNKLMHQYAEFHFLVTFPQFKSTVKASVMIWY